MAPLSRQERLQMRQRGAGARKVNNVDFGLSFGLTTGRVQRSAKKTPRPSHVTIRRRSQTPSRSGGQSSARRSVRSASATIDTRDNEGNKPVGLDEDRDAHAEEPGVKRRKTKDGYIPQPVPSADLTGSFSAPISVSSKVHSIRNSNTRRRTSGPVFVHIAEDPEDEVVPGQLAQNTDISKESNQRPPESDVEVITIDKENAGPDEHERDESVTVDKPKRKTRKRRSIGQQSGRKKKRPSNEPVLSLAEELLRDEAASRRVEEELEWETMIDDDSGLLPEVTSKTSAPSNTLSKKRRKRKSIVIKPRRRKQSGEFSVYSAVSLPGPPHDGKARVRDTAQQLIPADPTARVQYHRTTRRRMSGISDAETPSSGPTYEPEMEGDETYVDEAVSPEKPTPKVPSKKRNAKVKKGRRSESNGQSSSSRQADPSSGVKKLSKPTFPIVTHRMTNISALPTINDDAEDDLNPATDTSSAKTKFTDRSAPNAVDVLAQICRETISNTLSKQSSTSSTTSARELKRKRAAIEAFGSEIDSRLFDMSVAIEHRLTLEARVKKAKKAKTDAQNEWMEIRRQREEIAIRCDDVRARNLRAEADGKETYELSEQLHGLEMMVEKPELDAVDFEGGGLEFMLRHVAMTVSGAAGGGVGLLDRVKEYNRQLERTALVLEGRNLD